MRKQTKAKPTTLVLNHGTAAPALQGILTTNRAKLVRNDKMEGRDFVVVPMVMMVEGVHNGSGGALYYPAEELAKTPMVWNHKPVVVYHPVINGKGVSACEPKVIDTHKIGVIMNAKCDKLGRLTAEAWIEPTRANAIDPRVMKSITANQMMEVSTGVFTDNEETPGVWEGEAYTAIARNHRPDHLAILPDVKGACSLEDGAGLLRNQANALSIPLEGVTEDYLKSLYTRALVGNADVKSFHQISSELDKALREKFAPAKASGSSTPSAYIDVWVTDVFPDGTFVYSMNQKLYRQSYTTNGAAPAVLTGEPTEVIRVTEYKEVTKSPVANSQPTTHRDTMKKTAIIAALIANAASGYTEAHRAELETLSESTLETLKNNAEKATAKPVVPEAPKAPELNAEDRAALEFGKAQLTANRAKAIATIKANKANTLDDAALGALSINQLESIAAIAAASAAPAAGAFAGLAPVANHAGGAAPTANAETALPVPTMNFGKEANA
jgi:hypothetical protein